MADSVKMNYSQLSVGKEIMGSIHDETANLSSFLQQSEADLIQSLLWHPFQWQSFIMMSSVRS